MSTADFEDFDFGGSVREVSKGLVIVPILYTYLFDAKFPDFDLHFRKQDMEREPDNWYHPSTHPLWTPQALYRYLAYPESFPVEKKRHMNTLAVMFGKIWHEFTQMCLADAGILPQALQQPDGKCPTCPPEDNCHEPSFSDELLGERGHGDGILDLSRFPHVKDSSPVLEIKTSNDNFGKLSNIEDLDLEAFKKKWPVYYAQQQRYLKQFKRTTSIVVMIEPGWPYTMREFHIPIDYALINEIDDKYAAVRWAVANEQEPFCCRLKSCPAWGLCK